MARLPSLVNYGIDEMPPTATILFRRAVFGTTRIGFCPQDEGIWRCPKHVELGNFCCTDLDDSNI
jgi:hypothetical protein